MYLNKIQLAVIFGSIMGDAYLQSNGVNARLRFEHSFDQRLYLRWKCALLKDIFKAPPVVQLDRVHPITHRTYRYVRSQSKTLAVLREIRDVFYKKGKKVVPADLHKYLKDPISLAVWFMDDGYYYLRDRCGYLYLGNVSKNEADICQETLDNNFALKTKVLSKKKDTLSIFQGWKCSSSRKLSVSMLSLR